MENLRPIVYRKLIRWLILLFAIAAIPLGALMFGQAKLIYFARPYSDGVAAEWEQQTAGRKINYITSQGRQRAFLQGNLKAARNLWIVCGGNGSLALDWSQWLEQNAPEEDAYLLMDFPGYGDSQGAPTPERIRESMNVGVSRALEEIGWSARANARQLRFFGHSLGSAACLIAASEFNIQRGVIIAPFTSTMEMAKHLTGLPLGFLVWHRYDNSMRLRELKERGSGAVTIFHGTDDEVIPAAMSQTLANIAPKVIQLKTIDGGRHNTIQETHAGAVAEAMRKCGEPE